MQRIRTIKPELFTHELLFDLEKKEGLPIRFTFIGLFTVCDREGRFPWRPRMLKTHILPYDDVDFERILNVLVTNSLLVRYEVDGNQFGCIPTWLRHQKIRPDEAKSVLPEPPVDLIEKAIKAPNFSVKNINSSFEIDFPTEPDTNPIRIRNELVTNQYRGKEMEMERKGSSVEPIFFTNVKNIGSDKEYLLEKNIVSVEPVLNVIEETVIEKKKKPSTKKEAAPTLFTRLRKSFEEFYQKNYGSAYYFEGGKDAKALKSLIDRVTFKIKEKFGESFEEDTIATAFIDFCQAAHKSNGFVHDHFTLSILNQQFNSIFSLVKSIQNGTATSKRTNTMPATDALNYVLQERAFMRGNRQQHSVDGNDR